MQGFHFEAGVVGKAIVSVMLTDIAGFDKGVSFQGVGCFGDVFPATDFREADEPDFVGDDVPYFFQFMLIVGGKYQCLHFFLFF